MLIEPVFQFIDKAAVGLCALLFEKTDDDGASQTEKRGREGNAHAANRIFKALDHLSEQVAGVA